VGEERSSIIYLATNNAHKIGEISAIIGSAWKLRTLAEFTPPVRWEETGTTFLENALIKVSAAREVVSAEILGEDSGLCVDYLQGAPGLYSSSYGGEEGNQPRNRKKLLEVLAGVPREQRRAHFFCQLVFMAIDGSITTFAGRSDGEIAFEERGSNGFGYDSLFIPRGYRETLGELSPEVKHRISHRRHALRQWQRWYSHR
jgi:XTP/dITP diphosphohydrolase